MKDFSDIRILPRLTTISSRSECSTSCTLGPYNLSVPLIVASMHSLVSLPMISHVESAGSIVVQPRNMTYLNANFMALSTGFDNALERAELLPEGGILSVEVANGYQRRMAYVLKEVRKERPDLYIMAGTVCDQVGLEFLAEYADAILMGIGVGSACTTTINTGVGLPAAEMLSRLHQYKDTKIILCGGIRTWGDFVKAIALGADVVMTGHMFKDCVDTGKRYYGEASVHHKEENDYIEGTEVSVSTNDKNSYNIIQEAKQALQSAMSYSDSVTLDEFRARTILVD